MVTMQSARVRAPELTGRGWLNTGGRDIHLADLRGKIVLLDFWTFACINCLHVIDEIRAIEEKYADVLVVIGVHSPKFDYEKDAIALAAAVERYHVAHPVLDDPEMTTWKQYAAKAWPTLAVVDPTGYLVASMAGEGHAEGLERLINRLVAKNDADGTLHRGDGPYVPPAVHHGDLRFPGKAMVTADGTFLVSSSAEHTIVELEADAETVRRRIGTGKRGRADGRPDQAQFSEPQGLCELPEHVAEIAGYDIVLADTVNHLLRGLSRDDGTVRTVAGTGNPWRSDPGPGPHDAVSVDLSSPWDVAWFDDKVIVAMAGIHELWWFDPIKRTAGVYAGTTVEALRDGPLAEVWMAQPSGLSAAGGRLWIADSESSAIRWILDGEMHTAAGQGLFDFGLMDGPAATALFQHPLGVCGLPDGSVLVADTYNGAVRLITPSDGNGNRTVETVATGFAEPSDIVRTPDGGIVVVESGAHRLTRLAPGALESAGITADGVRMRTERPPTWLAPGEVTLDIIFTPPPGEKLDESFGPSTRLQVSASPPELLADGAGATTELSRRLVIADGVTEGVLQVVAQAATCDAAGDFPACHLSRQDWGVPIRVGPDGATRLPLILRGLDQG
ncbi:MAG TPA: NHL domain-containing thioredoxin family protein [Micromonosporaceae bacterium]|nr:NHL domain-containing thioredoxin family protein [Micromonosporaceae bacterium]